MDEFEIIETCFTRDRAGEGIVVGVGDDGAVLAPDPGRELVTVVDTLVAGTHFPDDLPPADIGFRAVAVNLSDIAAMAARPRWMTLALTLEHADAGWLEAFADGLYAAAAAHGVTLVGGDTTSGGCLVVTVQITGDVEPGRALTRQGARPGDRVYVTGTLGDAAAWLESYQAGRPLASLAQRFARPEARLDYGRRLAGRASAGIDVSDGLLGDLGKLAAASGVAAVLDLEKLPVSGALAAAFPPEARQRFALTGGDDYELLFTARPGEEVPDGDGLGVTEIGRIESGRGVSCHRDGWPVDVTDRGYRHFA